MNLPVNEILCGDCKEIMKGWQDNCVDLVITSPPYNIGKDYGEYEDSRPWPEFIDWFRAIFAGLWRLSKNVVFVIGTHNNLKFYTEARELFRLVPNCRCIYFPTWSIVNPIELAVYCYKDNTAWIKKHQLPIVCNGTLATYVPVVVGKTDTEKLYDKHPCTFPVRIPAVFIDALTNEGDIVFDPFMGSGTTAIAAQQQKRKWLGCEISEEYCKIARERIQAVESGISVKELRKGQIPLFPVDK